MTKHKYFLFNLFSARHCEQKIGFLQSGRNIGFFLPILTIFRKNFFTELSDFEHS